MSRVAIDKHAGLVPPFVLRHFGQIPTVDHMAAGRAFNEMVALVTLIATNAPTGFCGDGVALARRLNRHPAVQQ